MSDFNKEITNHLLEYTNKAGLALETAVIVVKNPENEKVYLANITTRSDETILPRPVVKDGNGKPVEDYTDKDWLTKLYEELYEVELYAYARAKALDSLDIPEESKIRRGLAEELADLITVCTSYLERLGYDEQRRSELFKQVNEKNERRGYFKERSD